LQKKKKIFKIEKDLMKEMCVKKEECLLKRIVNNTTSRKNSSKNNLESMLERVDAFLN
jgi:hypothetical protein